MENIKLNREDKVAVITIDRPQYKNALDGQTYDEFYQAMQAVKDDARIRVLVITGSGGAFCSGIDLAYAKQLRALSQVAFMRVMKKVQSTFWFERLSIPVIAAVNGYALGNGCDIALAADFILASEAAVFEMTYTTVGMIPDLGGTWRLPRRVGPSKAKELIFMGKCFTARQALEMGMVHQVFPDSTLPAETLRFARKLSQRAPIAVSMAKQAINLGLSSDLSTSLDFEAYSQSQCIRSQDSGEALAAMMEKREPDFFGT